jgi:invasion protein IalB
MSSQRLFPFVITLVATLRADCVIAQQLPNGASSISETYKEWTVSCGLVDGHKQCLLDHAQTSNQTGQRIFAIELRAPKDGETEGTCRSG